MRNALILSVFAALAFAPATAQAAALECKAGALSTVQFNFSESSAWQDWSQLVAQTYGGEWANVGLAANRHVSQNQVLLNTNYIASATPCRKATVQTSGLSGAHDFGLQQSPDADTSLKSFKHPKLQRFSLN